MAVRPVDPADPVEVGCDQFGCGRLTTGEQVCGFGDAEAGEVARATVLLDWLDRHRTTAGSLPEKVLNDGRPAAVAPLAWTAALTLLTVSAVRGSDES